MFLQPSANNPPVISGPSILNVTLNQASVFVINTTDPGDTFNFELGGTLPPSIDYTLVQAQADNGTTHTLTWTPTSHNVVSIQFIANDSLGAESVQHPTIILCACENGGSCLYGSEDGGSDRFLLLDCVCPDGMVLRLSCCYVKDDE